GGDDLAPLQQRLDLGVVFVLLKRFERLQARILVVEADDEADVDPVIAQVIEKTAAVGARVERPAQGVLNETGLHASGGQLPHFLEAEAIGLRGFAGIELEAANQLFRGAAAATLAEE